MRQSYQIFFIALLTDCRNVDRLWDIWQALNPDAYIIDKVASANEANFFLAPNERLTGDTDLKPFYDASATNFWTSNGVKFATSFGYAYPEVSGPGPQVHNSKLTTSHHPCRPSDGSIAMMVLTKLRSETK